MLPTWHLCLDICEYRRDLMLWGDELVKLSFTFAKETVFVSAAAVASNALVAQFAVNHDGFADSQSGLAHDLPLARRRDACAFRH